MTFPAAEDRRAALQEACERLIVAWREADKKAKHGAWAVCVHELEAALLAAGPQESWTSDDSRCVDPVNHRGYAPHTCWIAAPNSTNVRGADGGGRAQPEWQPIETAPKDGTKVLLSNQRRVDSSRWVGQTAVGPVGHWLGEWYAPPTHWMPLPNPPAVGGGAVPTQVNREP